MNTSLSCEAEAVFMGGVQPEVCALWFLYKTTLGCKEMIEEFPYPRFEKRLPVALSQTEVAARGRKIVSQL